MTSGSVLLVGVGTVGLVGSICERYKVLASVEAYVHHVSLNELTLDDRRKLIEFGF